MRAARTLSTLLLLQARGRLSAAELAALLEVSVRTVHRDVEHLSAAGVPVYATRGRDGGFSLLPGWHAQLAGLTNAEADTLTLAAVPSVAEALGLRATLHAAELKLATSRMVDPATMRARLHIDPRRWFFDEEHPEALRPLLDATLGDRRVRLRYRRSAGTSTVTIDPLGLVLKAGVWYVVGLHRSARRTYRLLHIESVEVTSRRFERPPAFDLAATWAESCADYEASVDTAAARIRVTPEALHRLASVSGAIARALGAQQVEPGETVEITVPVESHDGAVQLLLDPNIEVLGPPALRQRVEQAVAGLVHRYAPASVES